MPVTPAQIRGIMGAVCSEGRAGIFAPHLSDALRLADCLTVTRAAALLSQVAWETGQLRFLVEPEDHGHRYDGGTAYRGRGFVHLTHKRNYAAAGASLGLPLVENPDLAAEPEIAARVLAWYWSLHELNKYADARDFRAITRLINGAATAGPPSHHDRREYYYRAALEVLGITALVA